MRTDLPEGELELSIVALDSCGGQNIAIEYTLSLDLDGNGSQETVVQSKALPPVGKVLFNNILSPNYTLGDTIEFDRRMNLPDSLKYRFGLEISHLSDSIVAKLKWTTGVSNLNYAAPNFPLGKHRMVWRIEQGGVERFCEYAFEVKDCAPPVVTCLNNLSVNIMPTGIIQLWASDFLSSTSDNITPPNNLSIGVRNSGQNGVGFPVDANGDPIVSVVFHCGYIGLQAIELWIKDLAGNTDSCVTYLSVEDNWCNCECPDGKFFSCAKTWPENEGIEDVRLQVDGTTNFTPPFSMLDYSDSDGCGIFNYLPINIDFTLTPYKNDNPQNGVSTYDLVLTSKHILGIEPFDSPYKMIAADANKSGSITTFDIVELRKLILGIYDTLPNNKSWRFIDKAFVFPNQQNPFQTSFPENIVQQDWLGILEYFEFYGIKVGDVNNTAIPNATTTPPAESRTPNFLTLPDLALKTGETFEIPIHSTENTDWLGLQFGLDFDPKLLEIEAIESSTLSNFDQNNWAQPQAGQITLSWSSASPTRIFPKDELLRLRVKARADIRLSSAFKTIEKPIIRSESYDTEGFLHPLNLVFSENNNIEPVEVFAPQPNPTRVGVTLPIQLAQTETLRLEVLDLSGKLLWVNDWHLEKGSHLLEIPALAMPHNGMYIWQLQAGSVLKTGKITKI